MAEQLNKKIIAFLAHPDDESFGLGGTLAAYKQQGAETVVVSATRGEAGKCGDPPLCSQEDLGKIREQELRSAAKILGVTRLYFLDYIDKQVVLAEPWEIVNKMVKILDAEKPQVVIAFGPDGISYHKDHIAMSQFATMAFQIWASKADAPFPRLYYITLNRSIAAHLGREMSGISEKVHVRVPIAHCLPQKMAAIHCHQTQINSIRRVGWLGGQGHIPPELEEARQYEYFYQMFPCFNGDGIKEDLFY